MATISQDLESGICRALPDVLESMSLGTKVMTSRAHCPDAGAYHKPNSTHVSDVLFCADDGQALLLAFRDGKTNEETAVVIPVYRPSKNWAYRMVDLEGETAPLPVESPEKSEWKVERWKEFRWQLPGESEVDIWRRIRRQYRAQQPSWYSILPFWRPKLLEERDGGAMTRINMRSQRLTDSSAQPRRE